MYSIYISPKNTNDVKFYRNVETLDTALTVVKALLNTVIIRSSYNFIEIRDGYKQIFFTNVQDPNYWAIRALEKKCKQPFTRLDNLSDLIKE